MKLHKQIPAVVDDGKGNSVKGTVTLTVDDPCLMSWNGHEGPEYTLTDDEWSHHFDVLIESFRESA
jgi:hypothetical protein